MTTQDEIQRIKKRLILVSNIETYTTEDAIRKSTIMFTLATQLNNLLIEEFNPDKVIDKLIEEALKK